MLTPVPGAPAGTTKELSDCHELIRRDLDFELCAIRADRKRIARVRDGSNCYAAGLLTIYFRWNFDDIGTDGARLTKLLR